MEECAGGNADLPSAESGRPAVPCRPPRSVGTPACVWPAPQDCISGTLTLSHPDRLIAKRVNISSVCVCVCVAFCNFRGCFYERFGGWGELAFNSKALWWVNSSYFITLSLSLGPYEWHKYHYLFLIRKSPGAF